MRLILLMLLAIPVCAQSVRFDTALSNRFEFGSPVDVNGTGQDILQTWLANTNPVAWITDQGVFFGNVVGQLKASTISATSTVSIVQFSGNPSLVVSNVGNSGLESVMRLASTSGMVRYGGSGLVVQDNLTVTKAINHGTNSYSGGSSIVAFNTVAQVPIRVNGELLYYDVKLPGTPSPGTGRNLQGTNDPGSVVPESVHQWYVNTARGTVWFSTGLTTNSWKQLL